MYSINIVVNVVTYKKSVEEIKRLYDFINIKGNALFCNQSDNNNVSYVEYKGKLITIMNFNDIGVSKNRNHVLDNAFGDICINIDDDCSLVDNYEQMIIDFYNKYPNAKIIQFNGILCKENNRLIHNKKIKRITKFTDISFSGGPGLVYYPNFLRSLKIRYNEKIGYPNYVYSGEDSLFLSKISRRRNYFYRSNEVLFKVVEDIDNSTYFKGVDEQYCYTKGVGARLAHPRLCLLYIFVYTYKTKHWRSCKLKYRTIFKLLVKGLLDSKNYL